ncbi:hypothetical protein BN14_11997 [Rhizoctonia solani AG-1 IB]|uniref:Transmembrane protein n=1 Tax=Thanatephorus cucumeris (strain AG1-IB / isolate 7/3/14) TaxID=1108050 RepID=M5CHG7_THACB|nr:hypothetical protein BN14_11997 [Rhizoctonia solani AG-1 IB]
MATVRMRMNVVVVSSNNNRIICVYIGAVMVLPPFETKGASTMVTMALPWDMKLRGVFVFYVLYGIKAFEVSPVMLVFMVVVVMVMMMVMMMSPGLQLARTGNQCGKRNLA